MAQGVKGTGSAKERNLRYKQMHPTTRLETCRRYRINNLVKVRERARIWAIRDRKTKRNNLEWRIQKSLRDRLYRAIKFHRKIGSAIELVGCTFPELISHLESKFRDGMTWQNWGVDGWHIDHMQPCASFDLSDPEQQRRCFHYTNLQPLWASDNQRKKDRVCTPM